jgi:Domain of unknown function (DUF4748)
MNSARSVWAGWGTLMAAGAVAYYYAKKDINAHRREQELKGLRGTEFLECTSPNPIPLRRATSLSPPVSECCFAALAMRDFLFESANDRVADC